MRLQRETGFQNLLAQACSALAASFGLIALLGWILKLPLLSSFGLHLIPMAPSTALLFILMGVVIFFHARGTKNRALNRTQLLIGCLAALISLTLLILSSRGIYTDLEHFGLQIDGKLNSTPIGHMSPVTALSFLLVSLTFLASLSASSASPRRILAVWGLAGFILLTNYVFVLAYFLGLPLLYGINTIPPALPTSLASLALGIALLANASTQDKTQQAGVSTPVPYTILLVFTSLALSIVTGGYLYYQNYEKQFRAQVESQLSAIAALKAEQLQNWRAERISDAHLFYQNRNFSGQVQSFLENPQASEAQAGLLAYLEKVALFPEYDRIFLLDAQGLERISIPATPDPDAVPAALVEHAAASLASDEVIFLDFHRHAEKSPIHLALLVPIFDPQDHQPLGVLVLRINPQVYLDPSIQRWPVPSASAETLLVRREGEQVLYLNQLRFGQDTALSLRFPLTETTLPAVRAVLGETGLIEGPDYRGQTVIADLRAVPDSPWFLVSKMDSAEVFAPLRERLWQTIIFFGVLMVTASAGLMLAWRQQRANYYRAQYETAELLRKSQEQFKDLLEQAPDGIFIANASGQYLEVNSSGCALLGYTRDEILSKHISDLVAPEDVAASPLRLDEMRQGKTLLTERRLVRKDGSLLPVEISGRMLPDGRFQSIVRDITERKRVEDALRDSQAQVTGVFNSAMDAILTVDEDQKIIIFNPSAEQMFGCPANKAIGQTLDLFLPEYVRKDHGGYLRGFGQSNSSKRSMKAPALGLTCLRANGEAFACEVSISQLEIGGQKLYTAIVRDITERKQAENALREIQMRLQAIMDYSPALISIKDINGNIILANQGFAILDAPPLNELIGKNVFEIFPKDVAQHLWDNDLAALQTKAPVRSEEMVKHKDGTWHTYLTVKFPLYLQSDQLIGVCAISNDITERKKTEKQLRETKELYQALFDQSADAVFILDLDGRHVEANRRAAIMLGYEYEEILGLSMRDISAEIDNSQNVLERLLQGEVIPPYERSFRKKNGELINVEPHVTLICDQAGQPFRIQSIVRDITERKLAEQKLAEYSTHLEEMVVERTRELRDAQDQLVRQERLAALGQLAGSLGHELRNPLGVISNAVYFLKMAQPEASNKVREYLDIIEKETHTSNKIITDLLDFTRIKSLDRQPVSVAEIIHRTLERNPAPPSVEVQVEIPADLPPIFADSLHITQILGNLVTNAYQAMLPVKPASTEKKLKVSVAEQHDMIKITVTDTGPGIPPENLVKLFQPLFTTKIKGIGLGLAVSQKLVEANGGKIEVESTVGKGSAFTIYLPIYIKPA